ncbi:hypothetical protein QYH69_02395 [Paraburkholderia sp. SARCC-3016]|jgi:hypothetical protein|nr:hypothetical protein [Paraburkholderia sp. SARCC-3016]MDQ7976093.1 hypothetical protein [Paraburkholderia sp. SARCC-3016]
MKLEDVFDLINAENIDFDDEPPDVISARDLSAVSRFPEGASGPSQ